MVTSPGSFRHKLDTWRGHATLVDLEPHRRRLAEIRAHGRRRGRRGGDALAEVSEQLRLRARQGEAVDDLQVEAFSLVCPSFCTTPSKRSTP